MAVVQADFRQVAKLVEVAHRFGREEVKYGLGCKGGMLESWKNPTLVFKRPIKGGVRRQRENSLGRTKVGEELEVLPCELERPHQLPILRISSDVKNRFKISNLKINKFYTLFEQEQEQQKILLSVSLVLVF